jgi:O-antigen/teichoic acid export membrane protein
VTPIDAEPTDPASVGQDIARASQSALRLGGSLIGSWGVALAVRILIPRYLGPERFGVYNFADAFSATCFILITLGVDTYIHKEIPIRKGHASDFFGGMVAVRVALSLVVGVGMWAALRLAHRSPEVQALVFLFAAAQLFSVISDSLAAMLHATNSVSRLSVVNVAAKLLWALAIAGGALAGAGLLWLGAATLLAEAAKSLALYLLVRRDVGLRLRIDLRNTVIVVGASLPFFVNQIAHTAYAKVDATMLAFLSSDSEVGWYGAASNLAGLALLLTPLIIWVLMPLTTRAAARSEADLTELIRRSLQLILTLAIPITLLLGLGAETWITLVFGKAYGPATLTLRVLAPMFVLTYVAMVCANCLIRLDRPWTLTSISLFGLVLTPLFNLLITRRAGRLLGPGGAGAGAAASMMLTELIVTVTLLWVLGGRAFDRRNVSAVTKNLLAAAAAIVLDHFLRPLGPWRLVLDASAYVFLVVVSGAVDPVELFRLFRALFRRAPAEVA